MREKRVWKWKGDRSFIPCTITLCNALCGFLAITVLMKHPAAAGFPMQAVGLVFAAMFFDVFDGFVARSLDAESLHGMQLDSLSDALSFGMAPAIMVIWAGLRWWQGAEGEWIATLAAGFYLLCVVWRLAQYNTLALSDTPSKGSFVGLPSPAGALVICSVVMVLDRLGLGARTGALVMVAYAFVVGFLMVSGFEYMHAKRLLRAGPRPVRLLLAGLVALACVRYGAFAVFALTHLYLLSGVAEYGLSGRRTVEVERT